MPMWPEEAGALYDVVENAKVTINASAFATLVGEDPQRIAIIFSTLQGTQSVSTLAAPILGQGICLAAGGPPVILTFADVGPLVQKSWKGFNGTAGNAFVAVTTVSLRRHPDH